MVVDVPMEKAIPGDDTVIRNGSKLILEMNDDRHIFVHVRGRTRVKFGRTYCPAQNLVGYPFGATLGLSTDGQRLQQIPHSVPSDWLTGAATEVTKDNSKLVDAGDVNQKLSFEEITAMKSKGKGGEAIVEALAQHSATFASKTEFAQAKYKKKKAKKYVVGAIARRATTAAIANAYFLRQPAKIGHLRIDTLAMLLSLANVGAGARVLVADGCGGLVLGAVAERLAGVGVVQGVLLGSKSPSREAISQFDSPHVEGMIREAELNELYTEEERRASVPACGLSEAGEPAAEQQAAVTEQPATERDADAEPRDHSGAERTGTEGTSAPVTAETDSERPQPTDPAEKPCATNSFTSCILAMPAVDPGSALRALLPLLAPSAPFAVYSPWQQPLAEAMHDLRTSHAAVNLALQESWCRAAQVLPGRTHPTMQMNHGGGYLLSGTVVLQTGLTKRPAP